jgi:tRNA(fMet)-specific endonuclease VapC
LSSRGGYLIDTNHLGAATTTTPVRRRLAELRRKGARIGTCVPVLCELEAGIHQVRNPARSRQQLDRLLHQILVWPIDRTTAHIYGELYTDLRRRGRVLSQVDMMLAALALQLGLTLVTTDSDFAALPDLKREDWTA